MPKATKKTIMKTTKRDLLLSLFSFLNEKNILDDKKTDLVSEPYLLDICEPIFLQEDTPIINFSNIDEIKLFLTKWLDNLKDLDFHFIDEKKEKVRIVLDEFIITELYYLILDENRKMKITIFEKVRDFFKYEIFVYFKKNDVPF